MIENKLSCIFKEKEIKLKARPKPNTEKIPKEVDCFFKIEGASINITVEANGRFLFHYIDDLEFHLFDEEHEESLVVDCEAQQSDPFKLIGNINKIKYRNTKITEVNAFQYDLVGINKPLLISNNLKWNRVVCGDLKDYNISFLFINCQIRAILPEKINNQSNDFKKISALIDNEVLVVSNAYSFCQSSKIEYQIKQMLNDNEKVELVYFRSLVKGNFPNLINPFRSKPDLWNDFLNAAIRTNMDESFFMESGLFQAIWNLGWNGKINDWVLISHVAALEGLCSNSNKEILDNKIYKKIRRLMTKKIEEINSENNFCNKEKLDKIIDNINKNDRIINGFPLKERIKGKFEEINLVDFYEKNKEGIGKAIAMRNKIAHQGWSNDQNIDLFSHIKLLRKCIYLIVAVSFNYQGEIYFIGEDEPRNIKDITD